MFLYLAKRDCHERRRPKKNGQSLHNNPSHMWICYGQIFNQGCFCLYFLYQKMWMPDCCAQLEKKIFMLYTEILSRPLFLGYCYCRNDYVCAGILKYFQGTQEQKVYFWRAWLTSWINFQGKFAVQMIRVLSTFPCLAIPKYTTYVHGTWTKNKISVGNY